MSNDKHKMSLIERFMHHVPNSVALSTITTRKLALYSIASIAVVLLGLLLWAAFTQINIIAIASGELEPSGQVKLIQHLEGGTIAQRFVKDGDFVKKGAALVKIDPTGALSELKKLQAKQLSLQVDRARLNLLLSNEKTKLLSNLDDISIAGKSIFELTKDELKQYLKEDNFLLKIQRLAEKSQIDQVQSQINQAKEELSKLQQEKELFEKDIVLYNKELNIYKTLSSDNYVSKRDYIRIQREVNKAKRELVNLSKKIAIQKEQLNELEIKLSSLKNSLKEKSAFLIDQIDTELSQLTPTIQRLKDQVRRTEITAPVPGYVTGLDAHEGNVIKPGGLILTLVPSDTPLQAKVQIKPRDVGQLKVGVPVKLKVLSYDFSRFGTVAGQLQRISATTLLDKDNQPYYRGIVTLDQQYVRHKTNKLLAGMTVEADFVIGHQSILRYLLKPVNISLKSGLQER